MNITFGLLDGPGVTTTTVVSSNDLEITLDDDVLEVCIEEAEDADID